MPLPGRSGHSFRRRPLLRVSPLGAGDFRAIPTEIFHHLLEFLPFSDVGSLALTSEWMRIAVVGWVNSRVVLRRVLVDGTIRDNSRTSRSQWRSSSNGIDTVMVELVQSFAPFRSFAVLLKRLTCLLNTHERVRLAFAAFDKLLQENERRPNVSDDWLTTVQTARFAIMMHAFSRGWDESEYPVLLKTVDAKFHLNQRLVKFFECSKRQDVCVSAEMHLRLTLRCLTWDFAGSDYGHRATWLLSILNFLVGRNPSAQATLLFLLFGPSCQDGTIHYDDTDKICHADLELMNQLNNHADWDVFADSTPDDFHEGKDMFFTLAQVVCGCMTSTPNWRESMLTSVLDHLFTIPSQWKRENIAGFLLFCSERLILEYLKHKLDTVSDNCYQLVARLLVDMVIMSYRFENDLNPKRGIGKILDLICEYLPPGLLRRRLLHHLWRAITIEMESRELDMSDDELVEILQSFGAHIMHRAYNSTIGGGQLVLKEEIKMVDEIENSMTEEMEE